MTSAPIDNIDHKFMELLFPKYLLSQPVSYYLWMIYLDNRSLFKNNLDLSDTSLLNDDLSYITSSINNLNQNDLITMKKLHETNNLSNNNFLYNNNKNFQNFNGKLNTELKKKLWRRLNQLNVIGTLSFDSINDNYLIEVYKYFYPGNMNLSFNLSNNLITDDLKDDIDMSQKVKSEIDILTEYQRRHNNNTEGDEDDDEQIMDDDDDDDDDEEEEEDIDVDEEEDSEGSENSSMSEDDVGNIQVEIDTSVNDDIEQLQIENSENDIEMETESTNQTQITLNGDNDNNVAESVASNSYSHSHTTDESSNLSRQFKKGRISTSTNFENSQVNKSLNSISNRSNFSGSNNSEDVELTINETMKKQKENPYPHHFYQKIGYFLPYKWVSPFYDRLKLSDDGFSKLTVESKFSNHSTNDPSNINVQPYSNSSISENTSSLSGMNVSPNSNFDPVHDNGSSSNSNHSSLNRLRSSMHNANKKDEYSVTWANHFIPSNKLGIYYYEIEVLNTNKPNNPASNIIVGYKYWSDKTSINSDDLSGAPIGSINSSEIYSIEGTAFNNEGIIGAGSIRSSNIRGQSTNINQMSNRTGHIISTPQSVRRSSFLEVEATMEIPNNYIEHSDETSTKELDEDFMGYCGIDGKLVAGSESKDYSKPYGCHDIIGCGINYVNGTLFFTRNGVMLGTAFDDCHDCNFIPYIALKSGSSVKTNFGMFEEFAFDIDGYQDEWKAICYKHIFQTVDTPDILNEYATKNDLPKNKKKQKGANTRRKHSTEDEGEEEDDSVNPDNNNDTIRSVDDFMDTSDEADDDNNDERNVDQNMISSDDEDITSNGQISNGNDSTYSSNRLSNNVNISNTLNENEFVVKEFRYDEESNILRKPNTDKINNLQAGDGSLLGTLNTMINDYLIHEGLIDVAKGFLTDLKKEALDLEDNRKELEAINHNERQIIAEENNLRIRQELRRLINEKNISKCIECINKNLPQLLIKNIDLYFELRKAEYIMMIKGIPEKKFTINQVINEGQVLTQEFVHNKTVKEKYRNKFQKELINISSLLAYENPLTEAPEEVTIYLSSEYLHDRLFRMINESILQYLHRVNSCVLGDLVDYTRGMILTLQNVDYSNTSKNKYFKLLNLDEDILS
ncbi:hypothetical protein TBLA_0E00370 [Henningerozyma blattae CBS 6284]|uniref:CTLH domain-containing protein n=1 Tax=Henningerozyma blattae (strain ATCC 34711 / CBS 6284 / DSM 70876 / NBRC 10599 / NRRL Y-10934 / UCD 77-7) TaxID=1071380 RepID=I2H3Z6_HENB6|nr:hypothetical protein TBLA_0E00370 [Tetrapisispora blattae CBS 6284]CCH61098.1 hypothetical protein TBLA_0E00370 [Tetrapisispora blattae CBS 6284]